MEMIYIHSLASCLFHHSNWLNKHVRAKYRPGENVHGCFRLFSLFQFIFTTLIKDVTYCIGLFNEITWWVFLLIESGHKLHITETADIIWTKWASLCSIRSELRECTVPVLVIQVHACVSVQGSWRRYWDGRLHQTRDSASGLQFQEFLYWDGI